MEFNLSYEEIRVLGCLIEKEMATPEYYPLSMNALVNACNQKSNRNPVVSWDEDAVFNAIEGLKDKKIVFQSNLSRVAKYEESFTDDYDLIPAEAAILCILMLRGPQTAGEIRGRTERLSTFENLESVNATLENLISLNRVKRLPRQPGRKEVRYIHVLGSEEYSDDDGVDQQIPASAQTAVLDESVAMLEDKVEILTDELNRLKQEFETFKKQFD